MRGLSSLRISPRLILALLLGLAVLAAVLLSFDLGAVLQALARVRPAGFILIVAAGLVAEALLSLGLIPLLPRPMRFSVVAASRQLRDSAADVLPITQLGGVVLAARALVLAGMGVAEASAAVIADLTAETFAQGLYVLTGVVTSLSVLSASASLSPYVHAMPGGALFLSFGAIGFALVQIGGSKYSLKLGEKIFPAALIHARAFHDIIGGIYRQHGRLAFSILLQFAGWIGSGMWLWVMLRVMGLQTGIWTAIAIQALLEGLRSATVFIPASLGVQEIGYAALAPVFGLTPEIGLAVSLLRRARDIVVAVPVLFVWQMMEARHAAKEHRPETV
jgi:putative membrane protein